MDRWRIFDSTRGPDPIGVVDVDWAKNVPESSYVKNLSGETEHKGVVQDFLERFANRTGEIQSSMHFTTTDGRQLGRELWEDRLPRVVEAPAGDLDTEVYRLLSEDNFDEWLRANSKTKKAQ
jgi:hypothetical protein